MNVKPSAVAWREAGRAVVSVAAGMGVQTVSVEAGGQVKLAPSASRRTHQLMRYYLAGPAAEQKATGAVPPNQGWRKDFQSVNRLARQHFGATGGVRRRRMVGVLVSADLTLHWRAVERVANALEQERTLNGQRLAVLCGALR